MCGGDGHDSHRPSLGGTIAILKPISTSAHNHPFTLQQELSLRLSVDESSGKMRATIDGLGNGSARLERQVVIHRDGDLTSNEMTVEEASVLHSFAVPRRLSDGEEIPLDGKIDLGVGGQGVIGRRVSILKGDVVVGTGVMGWN